MNFAPVDDATLRNWHAQAVKALGMLRGAGATASEPYPPVADKPGSAGRAPARTAGQQAWVDTLAAEMTKRGLEPSEHAG